MPINVVINLPTYMSHHTVLSILTAMRTKQLKCIGKYKVFLPGTVWKNNSHKVIINIHMIRNQITFSMGKVLL